MITANRIKLVVREDFSATPGPRAEDEGFFSGEVFREKVLEPKLKLALSQKEKLFIDLDGTAGYGTSFLEEAFGGLIRINKYKHEEILNTIEIKSEEESYLIEDIYNYLEDAKNEK